MSEVRSIVGIITARGGSKRIPKKNIKDFCGKPIIAYSIEAAQESGLFDTVMVSTDSEEIAAVAKHYGAEVPFMRSRENANDYADTTDVLLEVLEEYQKRGCSFDEFCCLYPTAPFITGEKLRESHKLLSDKDVFNVIPMVPFSFPPQRGMKRDGRYIVPAHPEYINSRSQDLEEILHDCGQFYWCKTKEFMENPDFLSNHTVSYMVSEAEVQDIDNESDWRLAEIKYQYMQEWRLK
jgi:N-acylneuraminate cytidylyltransferase